jgi:glycerol-3-phosphate acyltransferase PlsY
MNFYHELNDVLPKVFTVEGITNPQVIVGFGIVAGLFAVLGHNYTCWLHFKGGKGIATSAGVLTALVPWALLIILAVWIVLFALTRYVSVGSLASAAVLPFATWFTTQSILLTVVTSAMSALAIYKHKGNIQRLLAGTESRINFKKEKTAT